MGKWILSHLNSHDPRPQFVPTNIGAFVARHNLHPTPDWLRRYEEACKELDFRQLHDRRYLRKVNAANDAYLRLQDLLKQQTAAVHAAPEDKKDHIDATFEELIREARDKWDEKYEQYMSLTDELEVHKERLEANLRLGNGPTLAWIDREAAIEAEDAAEELRQQHKAERPRKNSVTDVAEPYGDAPGPDKWANYYALKASREREAVGPMPPLHFKSQKSPPVSVPPHMAHGDEWQRATNRQSKHYKR